MKKFLPIFLLLAVFSTSVNAVVSPKKAPKANANEIFIPVGKNHELISLMQLSRMKVKELEAITGNKMKLIDKIGFKIAQKQLRSSINADGSFNNRKINRMTAKAEGGKGFHLGGFALGFLLGLIGVLIAYLIRDDKKATRVKWAWIGFAVAVGIWLILILAAFNTSY